MPQTRILPRSSVLAVLGSQAYKELSSWQNRAYRAPGTTPNTQNSSATSPAIVCLPRCHWGEPFSGEGRPDTFIFPISNLTIL